MKVYRVHYNNYIKQGMFQGDTGKEFGCKDIIFTMRHNVEFMEFCKNELHKPHFYEFDFEPSKNALFYFKHDIFHKIKHLIDDFIQTAKEMGTVVNVVEIDLDSIQSYKCYYQDENQICLEIFN